MRKTYRLLLIPILFLVPSCYIVTAVHPFCAEEDMFFDRALLGEWVCESDDMGDFIFRKGVKSLYDVTYIQGEISTQFLCALFKLEGMNYLNFFPVVSDSVFFYSLHLIPLHSVMQCSISEDELVLSPLDYDWLVEGLKSEDLTEMNFILFDERYILSSETEHLREFLIDNARNKKAFLVIETWKKKN